MGLFKSIEEQGLDRLLDQVDQNMKNNYKDEAQKIFQEFCEEYSRLTELNKISTKHRMKYEMKMEMLNGKLQNYSHKDQKPYWTK